MLIKTSPISALLQAKPPAVPALIIKSGLNRRMASQADKVAAGENGSVHFGLGMLPYTQYHLDIICPNIAVLGKDEQIIFGKKNHKMKRIKSAQCPCLGYE